MLRLTVRQITINDLPIGRDVDETLRLIQVRLDAAKSRAKLWASRTASLHIHQRHDMERFGHGTVSLHPAPPWSSTPPL